MSELFKKAVERLEDCGDSFLLVTPDGKGGATYLFPVEDEDNFLLLRDAAHQLSLTFNPFLGVSGENLINGKKVDTSHHEEGQTGEPGEEYEPSRQ